MINEPLLEKGVELFNTKDIEMKTLGLTFIIASVSTIKELWQVFDDHVRYHVDKEFRSDVKMGRYKIFDVWNEQVENKKFEK